MKKVFLFAICFLSVCAYSQDVTVLMKEAQNFERSLKEDEALAKYKEVLITAPANLIALVRASELSSFIAGRQTDKKVKKQIAESAKMYAAYALAVDSNSVDANYVMALAVTNLTEVETENKKIAEGIRATKMYADKALSLNPNHARANYIEGKWHSDMVQVAWVKKAAFKTLFGGMPDARIEDAISYMEKCKSLDQYYVLNYLELAKAYKFDNKPAKAIEVLLKLQKLPNRTADDAALKVEGKKLLESMQ